MREITKARLAVVALAAAAMALGFMSGAKAEPSPLLKVTGQLVYVSGACEFVLGYEERQRLEAAMASAPSDLRPALAAVYAKGRADKAWTPDDCRRVLTNLRLELERLERLTTAANR